MSTITCAAFMERWWRPILLYMGRVTEEGQEREDTSSAILKSTLNQLLTCVPETPDMNWLKGDFEESQQWVCVEWEIGKDDRMAVRFTGSRAFLEEGFTWEAEALFWSGSGFDFRAETLYDTVRLDAMSAEDIKKWASGWRNAAYRSQRGCS